MFEHHGRKIALKSGQPNIKHVVMDVQAYGFPEVKSIDDITMEMADQALRNRAAKKAGKLYSGIEAPGLMGTEQMAQYRLIKDRFRNLNDKVFASGKQYSNPTVGWAEDWTRWIATEAMGKEKGENFMAFYNTWVDNWAIRKGKTRSDWYDNHYMTMDLLDNFNKNFGADKVAHGVVTNFKGGNIARMFESSTFETWAHEFFHSVLPDLDAPDYKALTEALTDMGAKNLPDKWWLPENVKLAQGVSVNYMGKDIDVLEALAEMMVNHIKQGAILIQNCK